MDETTKNGSQDLEDGEAIERFRKGIAGGRGGRSLADITIHDEDFQTGMLMFPRVAEAYLGHYIGTGRDEFARRLAMGAVLHVIKNMNWQNADRLFRSMTTDPETMAELEGRGAVNPALLGKYPARRAGPGESAPRPEGKYVTKEEMEAYYIKNGLDPVTGKRPPQRARKGDK
jgi:hypothetical protein